MIARGRPARVGGAFGLACCLAFAGCTRYGFGRAGAGGDSGPPADAGRERGAPPPDGGGADGPAGDGLSRDGGAPDRGDRPFDGGVADAIPGPDLPLLPPPAGGLVGAWRFDEGVGQLVAGAPGSGGYRGTSDVADAADPSWEQAADRICHGAALTFDGGDDVVTIPGPSPAGLTAFTIAFSLYVVGDGGGGLARILTKENGGPADVIVHYRAMDRAIAVNLFNDAGALFATFAAGVVPGQRASWAVTYDDAGDRRLRAYKDGVETSYLRQDVLGGTLRSTTNPWRIGNEENGARGIDGTLDELRIYNRVLAPTEIAALSRACGP